ncbi:hypothetical protein MMC30_005730 [Trapelia coarctata]|nr:hypothetical protein [Trapelia coarctata]
MTQIDNASRITALPESHQASHERGLAGAATIADQMAQLLNGKEKEWAATAEKRGRLQLLDLPVDILREIIKEVTHTNDLTSLALTHSALHDLAIPYIYSRFDIVWPETQVTSDPRTGVDALTYGLSTLVMSESVFTDSSSKRHEGRCQTCSHCGRSNLEGEAPKNQATILRQRRKGNDFARYTRKFSLGNGPADWVQEYLIAKESGKMLGTLVALAVARMPNLEAFVWDMPTGVLRDVWCALSSLGDDLHDEEPRLERIWIRWHDNKSILSPANAPVAGVPPPSQPAPQSTGVGGPSANSPVSAGPGANTSTSNGAVRQTLLATSYRNVEHPNFSILPPLRSITVLDIDEPAYLDELSVLIERSLDRLRELRIGTASAWHAKNWTSLDQNTLGASNGPASDGGYLASGGTLGMVMSKLYDCRVRLKPSIRNLQDVLDPLKHADAELVADNAADVTLLSPQNGPPNGVSYGFSENIPMPQESRENVATDYHILHTGASHDLTLPSIEQGILNDLGSLLPASMIADSQTSLTAAHELPAMSLPHRPASSAIIEMQNDSKPAGPITASETKISPSVASVDHRSIPKQKKLRLEVLELEKVPLSVQVLQKTIDWSVLTSLTLLNCESDEDLWKALRRTYAPRSERTSALFSPSPASKRISQSHLSKSSHIPSSEYPLRLKKIHTNNVSPALIAFLKEALAPNSLEWMFLQDGGASNSKVTIDAIFRGPLRRHRTSLKKVMIDSGCRKSADSPRNAKSKKWMFNRDVLSFVTSGKMSCLRELAMAIDYKDWHFFLQRLPQIPHLRSLYAPYVADHVHGHQLEFARELALQVVDIVTLRPEIELCYMGITTKCFEILETKHSDDPTTSVTDLGATPTHTGPGGADTDDDSDLDNDHDDDEDDAHDEHGPDAAAEHAETETDEPEDSDGNSDDDEAGSEDGRKRMKLKLREILFYDDKVSIFKARHGQL